MAKRICLDAGHYGKYNRSPVVPAYYESDMNWKLHLMLKKELESYGFEVITTRANKDKDLALEARGKAAKGCDLFLSLHSNAASSESVNYVVCMHQVDDNCGAIDEQSKNIADLLSTTVADIMRVKPMVWASPSSVDRNGDGYKDDYFGVLRGAHSVNVAGVILEHGFHTNKAQTLWLMDDSNLLRLAKAEAEVLAKYFGMTKKPEVKKGDYTMEMRLLRKGSKGEDVRALQILLIGRGYSCGRYGADGDFGAETDKAVRKYQAAKKLEVDGIVGPDTMGALLGV